MLIVFKKARTVRDHTYKEYTKNEDGDYEEIALGIEIHHPCYKIIRQIIEMNKCNYRSCAKHYKYFQFK